MNNASLTENTTEDTKPRLRGREGELVTIIEALRAIEASAEWSSLKTYVFDGVVESLMRRLVTEASKSPLDDKEIYNLQGQLQWAKKYANLQKLADGFVLELKNVRLQLNPPTERDIGSRYLYG